MITPFTDFYPIFKNNIACVDGTIYLHNDGRTSSYTYFLFQSVYDNKFYISYRKPPSLLFTIGSSSIQYGFYFLGIQYNNEDVYGYNNLPNNDRTFFLYYDGTQWVISKYLDDVWHSDPMIVEEDSAEYYIDRFFVSPTLEGTYNNPETHSSYGCHVKKFNTDPALQPYMAYGNSLFRSDTLAGIYTDIIGTADDKKVGFARYNSDYNSEIFNENLISSNTLGLEDSSKLWLESDSLFMNHAYDSSYNNTVLIYPKSFVKISNRFITEFLCQSYCDYYWKKDTDLTASDDIDYADTYTLVNLSGETGLPNQITITLDDYYFESALGEKFEYMLLSPPIAQSDISSSVILPGWDDGDMDWTDPDVNDYRYWGKIREAWRERTMCHFTYGAFKRPLEANLTLEHNRVNYGLGAFPLLTLSGNREKGSGNPQPIPSSFTFPLDYFGKSNIMNMYTSDALDSITGLTPAEFEAWNVYPDEQKLDIIKIFRLNGWLSSQDYPQSLNKNENNATIIEQNKTYLKRMYIALNMMRHITGGLGRLEVRWKSGSGSNEIPSLASARSEAQSDFNSNAWNYSQSPIVANINSNSNSYAWVIRNGLSTSSAYCNIRSRQYKLYFPAHLLKNIQSYGQIFTLYTQYGSEPFWHPTKSLNEIAHITTAETGGNGYIETDWLEDMSLSLLPWTLGYSGYDMNMKVFTSFDGANGLKYLD